MPKIAIITGSRAEYGLLEPIIKICHDDPDIDSSLIVTGSHLSHEFGYTANNIHYPYIPIECVLSSDTAVGISKSMGLTIISFAEVYERINPDIVILLGDRYEIFMAASAAHIARIPIVHIHGGEITAGAYDDAFRHSITKMAQLHFVAAEPYRQRVIQLGEHPNTVFNVGALGCDGLEKRDYFSYYYPQIIFSYYSETLSALNNNKIRNIIENNCNYNVIDICPSSDVGNRGNYGFSFNRGDYIKQLLHSICIIGNSSSGIIEAPALGVPTINIGDRQKGRLMADSIIQAEPTKESISQAFDKLYSDEFQEMMKGGYYCPYQGGNVAEKIVKIIKEKISSIELKKGFYDISQPI